MWISNVPPVEEAFTLIQGHGASFVSWVQPGFKTRDLFYHKKHSLLLGQKHLSKEAGGAVWRICSTGIGEA